MPIQTLYKTTDGIMFDEKEAALKHEKIIDKIQSDSYKFTFKVENSMILISENEYYTTELNYKYDKYRKGNEYLIKEYIANVLTNNIISFKLFDKDVTFKTFFQKVNKRLKDIIIEKYKEKYVIIIPEIYVEKERIKERKIPYIVIKKNVK